jgi:hypothetical protein
MKVDENEREKEKMGRYLRRLRRSAIVQITGDTVPPLMPPLPPPHAMVLGHPSSAGTNAFPRPRRRWCGSQSTPS